MFRLVLVTFLSATVAVVAADPADSLDGGWRGTWIKDGDTLPVTVTFAKTGDTYSGAFDSDGLQVAGIPLSNVSDSNGRVHFQISGDQSTTVFDGEFRGDTIAGSFTDGSGSGSFQLVRAALPSLRIRTRDVTFQDKDVTLGGTILLPAAPGRHRAIVFLHGSGPEARSANHYLAQKLAERGVVSLIYDKRGVGQSTGDWQTVGFDALADDAVAGVRFLQSQSEVDGTRVGIYGHSQGGTIAPLVGVRAGDLRFIIASAAGGIDPADVETYSVENAIGMATLSPMERADAQNYVYALVDVAYRGKSHVALDAMAATFRNRDWYFAPPSADNSYWLISKQIAAFKPEEYWRQIKAPVLLAYGAHDERVPPHASAKAIEAAVKSRGNGHVTVKMYPNADHTFTIVDPPRQGGWPKHEPDYADVLATWILAQR
jgi:dipeptidyl aminopeptidase/acylaminoacyl peptidase